MYVFKGGALRQFFYTGNDAGVGVRRICDAAATSSSRPANTNMVRDRSKVLSGKVRL